MIDENRSESTASFVEFYSDEQVLNFRCLVDIQPKFHDSNLIVPTTPGLGFGFDDKAVDKYAVEKWA